MGMLWGCCGDVVGMFDTCGDVVGMLWGCLHVMGMLWGCCGDVMGTISLSSILDSDYGDVLRLYFLSSI